MKFGQDVSFRRHALSRIAAASVILSKSSWDRRTQDFASSNKLEEMFKR
jgi:hypothetical protein